MCKAFFERNGIRESLVTPRKKTYHVNNAHYKRTQNDLCLDGHRIGKLKLNNITRISYTLSALQKQNKEQNNKRQKTYNRKSDYKRYYPYRCMKMRIIIIKQIVYRIRSIQSDPDDRIIRKVIRIIQYLCFNLFIGYRRIGKKIDIPGTCVNIFTHTFKSICHLIRI